MGLQHEGWKIKQSKKFFAYQSKSWTSFQSLTLLVLLRKSSKKLSHQKKTTTHESWKVDHLTMTTFSGAHLPSEKIGSISRHGTGKMKGKIQLLNFQLQKHLKHTPACFLLGCEISKRIPFFFWKTWQKFFTFIFCVYDQNKFIVSVN